MTRFSPRSLPRDAAGLLALLFCLVATGCLDFPETEAEESMSVGRDDGSGIEGFDLSDDDDSAGDDDDSAGDDDNSAGDDDDSAGDDVDSAGDRGPGLPAIDTDGDGVVAALDCDDDDPENYPGNLEICDGVDNDCDGRNDNGFDVDGDGWSTCGPDGMPATADDDCDDADAESFPGSFELCDGLDNDCDAVIDEDYQGAEDDVDGDGAPFCTDCDDDDPDNFPGNVELCDGLDNDCDPRTDEDLACDGEDEGEEG